MANDNNSSEDSGETPEEANRRLNEEIRAKKAREVAKETRKGGRNR